MDLSQIYSALLALAQAINSIQQSVDQGLMLLTASDYPTGATPIAASSGNVSNSSAVATLPASTGTTTYILGFDVTSTGATSASGVNVTVANTTNSNLTYRYASVAGATTGNQTLSIRFPRPIPANTENLAITVTLPALGSGNTGASVSAYGYRL